MSDAVRKWVEAQVKDFLNAYWTSEIKTILTAFVNAHANDAGELGALSLRATEALAELEKR